MTKSEENSFDVERYVTSKHPDVLKLHKLEQDVKEARSREKELIERLAKAQENFERALAIKNPHCPPKLKTKPRRGVRIATPVLMCSDTHVEEEIHPDRVNGMNSFDLKEAERRFQNYWDGNAWMIKWLRNPVDGARPFSCNKVCLWLGGDLITSYLHEENEETNLLAPLEAIRFAQRLVMQGINHLLEDDDLEELLVVCNWGNHGRMHKRKRYKSAAKNNLEWMMYWTLADVYASNERVRFQIASGAHEYADIEGTYIRFTHGDDWRYEGGVGGLSVPVLRGVSRLDQGSQRHVDFTVLGHFHTFQDFGKAIVNGSLCGYGEYALSKSFPYEEAMQGFFIVDGKRGKSLTTPIWVTNSSHISRGPL